MNEYDARVPGRVNLIGEHTDYNGGFVLPTTIPHETHVTVTLRSDRLVHARSLQLDPGSVEKFQLGDECRQGRWIDYVQGVTWAIQTRATRMTGFDLVITSTVPIGKGLSSSASLEVAVARALNSAYELNLTGLEIALLCHRAETEFVGAPVGVMDHMACSLADPAHALFLDTLTMRAEKIPLPSQQELGLIDSGIAHAHASGEYRIRRQECVQAAALLRVGSLREISTDDLPRVARLPEPLNRRARHVVTENHRVLAAVEALRLGVSEKLGVLFLESHASMRDDFEISTPEIDALVDMAAHDPDALGARLTGGGFGGAVVILCAKGRSSTVTERIARAYRERTGREGAVLVPCTV